MTIDLVKGQMETTIFHTKFWDDEWISSLSQEQILLYNYLLNNRFVNILHLYELPISTASINTKIPVETIKESLLVFQQAKKIDVYNSWIYLCNANKYRTYHTMAHTYSKLGIILEMSDEVIEHFQKPILWVVEEAKTHMSTSDKTDETKYDAQAYSKLRNSLKTRLNKTTEKLNLLSIDVNSIGSAPPPLDMGVERGESHKGGGIKNKTKNKNIINNNINNKYNNNIYNIPENETSDDDGMGDVLEKLLGSQKKGGIHHQWQAQAFNFADSLGIDMGSLPQDGNWKSRWLRLFKSASEDPKRMAVISNLVTNFSDYPRFQALDSLSKVKYFFAVYNQNIGGNS